MARRDDEKTTLVAQVRELHLPTMRSGFEEQAKKAKAGPDAA